MKEILLLQQDGSYFYSNKKPCTGVTYIEIPDGANIALSGGANDCKFYGKNDSYFNGDEWRNCGEDSIKTAKSFIDAGAIVLWRREEVEFEVEKFDTDKMLADVEVQIATHSQHSHYFKDVRDLNVVDVYQVLKLFNVTDPCLQHIVKKALVAGSRGYKDLERDLKDIHDTAKRALEINNILH